MNLNIVNRSKSVNFSRICQIVFRRLRYITEIIVFPTANISKDTEKVITIFRTANGDDKLTLMDAHICPGYIPKTETKIMKYKIAAGINNNSVIVLREIYCPNSAYDLRSDFAIDCCEIIELIENLSNNYMHFLYHYNNLLGKV